MKCIVLAGGLGDKMWPLSRREYPKQFMNIKEDRSLLQETVGRNLSLCEEFFIMANDKHSFIVEGQMEAFQSLKYRCFYEEKPLGTAFPVVMACMSCNSSELIYVITADHFIVGNTYQSEIVAAMDYAREGKVVAFGVEADRVRDNFDYFKPDGNRIDEFIEHGRPECKDNCLANTGLFVSTAGVFLQEVRKYSEEYYKACREIHSCLNTTKRHISIKEEYLNGIQYASVEDILYKGNSKKTFNNKLLIKPEFMWTEVDSFDVFSEHKIDGYNKNIIDNNCSEVSVINYDKNKLVVVNDIEKTFVVNTKDALYVTSKENAAQIKNIIEENSNIYEEYFNHGRITYRPWGYRELLKSEDNFMVRKVVIFPSKIMDIHKHTKRSEHWSVVSGAAVAMINGEKQILKENMSAFVPIGIEHALLNETEEKVVIIEVSVGENINDKDFITITEKGISERVKDNNKNIIKKQLVKLEPAFKDYLWGGTKLRDSFLKRCDYDTIAESWELSAHEAGNSIVASGKFKGRTFSDYLEYVGKQALGWKADSLDRFPILIKFIDAKEKLSVQIHPNDEYAIKNENELGKNEMWYIMECDENSYVYCGVKEGISKEEIENRIKNNTIPEVLNKINVRQGDVIFVEAGTIHAIGEGILLCEIQQNSDCTYRIYDYNRKDRFGNMRELHLEKAMQVLNLENAEERTASFDIEEHIGYNSQILARCKYFECTKYEICDNAQISVDDTSFKSFVFINGDGIISDGINEFEFKKGDSFFMPAGISKIMISGKSTLLVTHI